jgi:H+/gluconate symporter-like permease
MSESRKKKGSDPPLDVELVKIQIYASHNQTIFTNEISIAVGFYFTTIVLLYTQYSIGFISRDYLTIALDVAFPIMLIIGYLIYRQYKKQFKITEESLKSIENKKRLPPLTELE